MYFDLYFEIFLLNMSVILFQLLFPTIILIKRNKMLLHNLRRTDVFLYCTKLFQKVKI
jgi:hypothetical protein